MERTASPWQGWQRSRVPLALALSGLFLWSVREVLNPWIVFALLLLVVRGQGGFREHMRLLVAFGVLAILWTLAEVGSLLAPFLLSLVLAYLLFPAVRWLEGAGRSRTTAILLLFVPVFLGMAGLIFVGVPLMLGQVVEMVQRLPELMARMLQHLEALSSQMRGIPGVDVDAWVASLHGIQWDSALVYLQSKQGALMQGGWDLMLGAGRGLGALISWLSLGFLAPILTFYLLKDYEKVGAGIRSMIPDRYRDSWMRGWGEYDHLLGRYLRGQMLAAALIGMLTGLGLLLVGFPKSLVLGLVAGVFNLVPYLGMVVILIPGIFLALVSGDPGLMLGKLAFVLAAVQALEGMVISPKVTGDAVGIHPVWVMLSMAMSGFLLGFVGLLIAVPLAVGIKLLLREGLRKYRCSEWFSGSPTWMRSIDEVMDA